ncbi:class I SAM-dependent methyltransferase [Paraburkholderia hospita]|uniref:class I SAM-dependent methyltransferase n=1 Tax=Paraburkholderia hospita TaxID=169430 RepID=UPI0009C9D434|nr:class I SAM-dependent methyltransferase [Paraburkholderia hospita]SKC63746.1 Methyltransferase domain-containing protein [Paraburkholderia hospita]
MTRCWCGNTELLSFSKEYATCPDCETLVALEGISPEQLSVRDDEVDYYGKEYWLGHMRQDFGYPDIHSRARTDLTERNLHWLKALLKYLPPPAKVLELGCSHGSFVSLLQNSGYDASGVEMSPWVVEFGRKTFNAPIFVGPVENLDIAPGSLDAIALMDVMEHLPDPVATMAHCLNLLKPDGLLLVQTPQFRKCMDFAQLVETNGVFLEQLKADEHLYLFSEASATRLFRQIGAEYIQFEPAIFAHYDMFFAVSRVPFRHYSKEQSETALASAPNGRLTLALLDLRERELASESDRIARGEQIQTLTLMVQESEADRAARGEQIETLTRMVRESENARAGFGAQVLTLTQSLASTEAERNAKGEEVSSLLSDLRALFGHRAFRLLAKIARWREAKKLENRINQQ